MLDYIYLAILVMVVYLRPIEMFPLQKLNRQLQRGLSSEEAKALSERSFFARKSIPCIVCTKFQTREKYLNQLRLKIEQLIGADVFLFHLDNTGNEVCFFTTSVPAAVSEKLSLLSLSATVHPYPSLFKIHDSVLKFLEGERKNGILTIDILRSRDSLQQSDSVVTILNNKRRVARIVSTIFRSASSSRQNKEDIAEMDIDIDLMRQYGDWGRLQQGKSRVATATASCIYPPSWESALDSEDFFTEEIVIFQGSIRITGPGLDQLSDACFALLVEHAAAHTAVIQVALVEQYQHSNYAARGITQGGSKSVEPYSKFGLDGAGQVVGVTDSGINDLNCMFFDDSGKYKSPFTTRSTPNAPILEVNELMLYIIYNPYYRLRILR